MRQSIKFGEGENSTSQENQIFISDNTLRHYHYLMFFDSRGLATDNNKIENSYLYRFKRLLDIHNLSYLIISKPKNLTLFATLYNFLLLNENFTFNTLVTNIGYVDLTPKKQDYLDDALIQIKQFSNTQNVIHQHEKYPLNNGNIEVLQSIEYQENYLIELNSLLNKKFKKKYFINTPAISKDIQIERSRPDSFFQQLHKTNELIFFMVNFSQTKNRLIDIHNITYTYDAVHYTDEGHKMIFDILQESIKL
ncbi:hypothetical protein [Sulfuricurvum sp. PD_MW2]|jgi:hypothetical protein|uniref:hypothetical protein n=1 Tax=Sulfuricurvum sp. PD_MW2 TaxID=2027917 RepID=UPI0025DF912A|nr:hypothetical protein [Sulfuricurvum sp. PD_MW2]